MQSLNKPIILFDIDYTLFNTALFKKSKFAKYSLYSEVPDVLSALSKELALGIFSQGDEEFQKTKLQKTKIDRFFQKEHTYIGLQKDEIIKTVLDKYKNSNLIIADDKLFFLASVRKHNPQIFTIWIKRGYYAENQKPIPGFTADAVMENLSGIIPIINRNYGLTLHSL